MDGHEKVSCKCSGHRAKHAGRKRKDGTIKKRMNGWFMAIDPRTGIVLSVREMQAPENNQIAVDVLKDVVNLSPQTDCVVDDRMCSSLKKMSRSSTESFKGIKYWAIDEFHAHGHAANCPCNPLVHKKLARRLSKTNTSVAEQSFAWFRGYASSLNTMARETHLFYVLDYVQRHDDLMRASQDSHLNPFSTKRKIGLAVGAVKKPASKKYVCRKAGNSGKSLRKKPCGKK